MEDPNPEHGRDGPATDFCGLTYPEVDSTLEELVAVELPGAWGNIQGSADTVASTNPWLVMSPSTGPVVQKQVEARLGTRWLSSW